MKYFLMIVIFIFTACDHGTVTPQYVLYNAGKSVNDRDFYGLRKNVDIDRVWPESTPAGKALKQAVIRGESHSGKLEMLRGMIPDGWKVTLFNSGVAEIVFRSSLYYCPDRSREVKVYMEHVDTGGLKITGIESNDYTEANISCRAAWIVDRILESQTKYLSEVGLNLNFNAGIAKLTPVTGGSRPVLNAKITILSKEELKSIAESFMIGCLEPEKADWYENGSYNQPSWVCFESVIPLETVHWVDNKYFSDLLSVRSDVSNEIKGTDYTILILGVVKQDDVVERFTPPSNL